MADYTFINSQFIPCWYALRVTYSREMALKTFLDQQGIQSYIPMCYKEERVGTRLVKRLVPSVRNLIFVYSSKANLDEIRLQNRAKYPMHYLIDKNSNQAIIISDKDMNNFISVNNKYDNDIVTLSIEQVQLKTGVRVRVKDGHFKGVEGKYMRVAGDRRVVVSIDNLMVVGTAFIHPSSLEVLE